MYNTIKYKTFRKLISDYIAQNISFPERLLVIDGNGLRINNEEYIKYTLTIQKLARYVQNDGKN